MSQFGTKRTWSVMSAFGDKADIVATYRNAAPKLCFMSRELERLSLKGSSELLTELAAWFETRKSAAQRS